ncbi:MAG TPA: hypothetical protein VER77_03260 [Candidatus Dormibacteraeota bacterium]|nr:hypothetical protein [Candidatus Dormibacteraeota bacterium]
MAARKAFLLRIDPELWGALEKWAADELRSVNGQTEYLLARAVRDAGRGPKRSPTGAPPTPGGRPAAPVDPREAPGDLPEALDQ